VGKALNARVAGLRIIIASCEFERPGMRAGDLHAQSGATIAHGTRIKRFIRSLQRTRSDAVARRVPVEPVAGIPQSECYR